MATMEEKVARLDEKMDSLKETLDKLDHNLFGNGQPGVIETLWKRVRRLEYYLAMFMGAGTVIVWLMKH